VRRGRRISEFLVVTLPASDEVVSFCERDVFECLEVVHPLLDGDETRTRESRALFCEDPGGECVIARWVFGAVLIAGQVAAPCIHKSVDHLLDFEVGFEIGFERAAGMHQLAAIGSPQPAPEGGLCRRDREAGPAKCRESAQARDFGVECEGERLADPDHEIVSEPLFSQGGETGQRFPVGQELEAEASCERRDGCEDAGLGIRHEVSTVGQGRGV